MNRWVANKLGLINFWYYDEEEFQLADGKLLFRGSNGSGKSVTMQSFIPLLLDGNKAPERLDPFGSKARRIENYLLDEETNERTAYLYIEFKRQEQEHYLTIGMGMKAVKNKPLDSWYFLITDGRRVGKDIKLYREAGEKIPLTKKQLENEIKDGGLFTTAQGEYMRLVNEHLFGFESIEGYEELLSLLINLRSPKLSKDFKPTEIYKILSSSLKVLSEDDLRPMSEAMENMDSYQGNLDSYKRTQNACKNIKYHYDAYNRFKLLQKAQAVTSGNDTFIREQKSQQAQQMQLTEMKEKLEKSTKERLKKEAVRNSAEEQYERLSNRKEVGIKKELLELEDSLRTGQEELKKKQKQLEDKREQYHDKLTQKKKSQEQYEQEESKLTEKLDELQEVSEDCFFEEGGFLKKEVAEHLLDYDFEYIKLASQKYFDRLRALEKEIADYEKAKGREEEALKAQDEKEREYLGAKAQAEEANRLLLQAKEDYKVHFVDWQKEAFHMAVSNEERTTLFKTVDALEKEAEVYHITEFLRPFYEKKSSSYQVELERKKAEIDSQQEEINTLSNEIEKLKNAKEIEPQREATVIKNRQRLSEAGISFSPFYKVIDFKKETPELIKGAIESALVSMGLIDALVVNKEDLGAALSCDKDEADRYLSAQGNMMRYNLSQYLEVDQSNLSQISFETVDNLLTGIYLDEDQTAYINEKGEYGLGILKGKADLTYETKYIGASARKKHREALIEEKKQEIAAIKEKIEALMKEQEAISLKIKETEMDYKKLPAVEDLREMLTLRNEKEKEADQQNEAWISLQKSYFECQQRCRQMKAELFEKMQGIKVPAHQEDFEQAVEGMRQYRSGLVEAQAVQSKLIMQQEILRGIEESLASLDEDIDNILYESNQKEQELRMQEDKQKALREVLKTTDIEAIEEQLDWCLRIKKEMPDQLKALDTAIGALDQGIEAIKRAIDESGEKVEEAKEKLDCYIAAFKEEYALGYVYTEDYEQPVKCCIQIVESLGGSLNKNEQEYISAVWGAVTNNGADLREYGMKIENLPNGRFDIAARIDGKEIHFYQFSEMINKYIEDIKLLINEEERHIFEEVLLNTISSKITSKIYLSKQWIDKINKLMESMKTSSSLKLSLRWVPKKAENEGQLDISELLKLLELGDRCSDSDMKKITDHFGAKVREGIRNYEGTSDARNYHTIIQEVLDYRQWYEFKLYFEKKNEKRKELTNNDFFRFSGGEKAMSMYIPLFSAVYARYENAKKDCPRIISMDEAFAGVDEDNIRDMFRLLEELDLDFIINSQVLWGDYDTVKNLAISEIIREENDTTVLVLNYHWNGIQRELVV